jgi:predicted RND superfamily exporter protein
MKNNTGTLNIIIIAVTLIVTGFFAAHLPKAELDNNNYRFIPEDDPARLTVNYIDDTFKNTNYILIALEHKTGGIFDPVFLNRLYKYIEQIKTFDIVEDIESIVSSNYIYGVDDEIIIEALADTDSEFDAQSALMLRQKILSWDFYKRTLVSDDLLSTQVMITLNVAAGDSGKTEVTQVYSRIHTLAREMFTDLSVNVYAAGLPVISSTINESVKRDLRLLLPLVIFVVLAIMYIPVRSCKAVLYVLLPVFVSIICTIGAMPLFNVKLSIISTVIPVVLVAVGNSYGLHVVMRYIDGIKKGVVDVRGFDAHKKYVQEVIRTVRGPVMLAALTTLVSFLAFCWTKVPPLREFGIFSTFGVLIGFITSITFLPAVLTLSPLNIHVKKTLHKTKLDGIYSYFADAASGIITRRKKIILGIGALIIGIAAALSSKLIVDNIFIEYFREDTDIVRSDEFIRAKFGGTKILSIMLESESSDVILNPQTLAALDNLNLYLVSNVPVTGKIMSYTDLIKRINLVLNSDKNDPSYYEIPTDPERYGKTDAEELRFLISNYLFFLADISESYANDPFEPTAIRSVVQLAALGEHDTNTAVYAINEYVKNNFPPEIKVTIGGTAVAEIAVNHLVVQSVWSSMIIASVCLFIIISLVNKSFIAGLLALLPLFAVVTINFAVMGAAGIKLNIGTAMISSLAMGIGIDYTIHFMESIKREYKLNPAIFLRESFSVSGAAIITDAVSTSAGFAVLFFSRFVMLAHFGALVCLSLVNSALAGLILVPSLILLIKPRFVKK